MLADGILVSCEDPQHGEPGITTGEGNMNCHCRICLNGQVLEEEEEFKYICGKQYNHGQYVGVRYVQ